MILLRPPPMTTAARLLAVYRWLAWMGEGSAVGDTPHDERCHHCGRSAARKTPAMTTHSMAPPPDACEVLVDVLAWGWIIRAVRCGSVVVPELMPGGEYWRPASGEEGTRLCRAAPERTQPRPQTA